MKLRYPDGIAVVTDDGEYAAKGYKTDIPGLNARCEESPDGLKIRLYAPNKSVKRLRLVWDFTESERRNESVKVLGDCWERGYGDLQWTGILPYAFMPWTVCVSNGSDSVRDPRGRFTECFGVKARPAAMAAWQYEQRRLTLNLDVRSGGEGVRLGGRELEVCTVVFAEYRDMYAYDAINGFYRGLCDDPVFPGETVYGSNNWYYAYGVSDREQILKDAGLIALLTPGFTPRPFMVIDAGWTARSGQTDLPDEKYGDMKTLAAEIAARGVKPGIWVRYLADEAHLLKEIPDGWRLKRDRQYMDPSHPEVLAYISGATRLISRDWGYRLIKHDFSCCDLFGSWGFARANNPDFMTDDGWALYRNDITSAEALTQMYRTIYESAEPGTVIIACNVSGFLTAGYAHINRAGDDTSGFDWERTRRMGVNTVAFRNMYDFSFYRADCDCVGIRGGIAWKDNSKWARLISASGTPLFFSTKPGVCSDEELAEISRCLKTGSEPGHSAVPLDWMETSCPEKWLIDGAETEFDWREEGRTGSPEGEFIRL